MATTHSAGIALCRPPRTGWADAVEPEAVEILIVHPGGPLWAGKEQHAWSIPKGEFDPEVEESDVAARREFAEELGTPAPKGAALSLGSFAAGRKTIWPWLLTFNPPACETINHAAGTQFAVESNVFEMIWPPKSGTMAEFPEVDVAQWVTVNELMSKLHKGQLPLVERVRRGLRQWFEQPDSFSTW